MEEKELKLEEIRKDIDAVNKEMLRLLIKRLQLCSDVAEYKKARGLPIYVPEREQAILGWAESTAGPGFAPYARRFFEQVMQLGRDYESGVMGGAESGAIIATRPDAVSTERIILLPLEKSDLGPVYAMTSNEVLMEGVHITPHQSEEEAAAFIAAETKAPNLAYKLVLRGTAQFAGMLSLKPDPDQPEKVLISVVLMESCWNQGYLTELLPTAEKLAREKLSAGSIWAYIPDTNLYASRAFFKAGYMVSSVLSLPEMSFQVCCKTLDGGQ